MIAEGDKVVVRGRVRATHNGEFPVTELKGITPTGMQIEWDEVWIVQVVDGRFGEEGYSILDGVSRLQQLGVLSTPRWHGDSAV
jgi:predicted ester cyclase